MEMESEGNGESNENIFTFRDRTPVPDPIFDYPLDLQNAHTPLIIDNGKFYKLF